MSLAASESDRKRLLPGAISSGLSRLAKQALGAGLLALAAAGWASLASWSIHDPSLNHATRDAPDNVLGYAGAAAADLALQSFGLAAIVLFVPLAAWGWHMLARSVPERRRLRLGIWPLAVVLVAGGLSAVPRPVSWPLPNGFGGIVGDLAMAGVAAVSGAQPGSTIALAAGLVFLLAGLCGLLFASGIRPGALALLWQFDRRRGGDLAGATLGTMTHWLLHTSENVGRSRLARLFRRKERADAPDIVDSPIDVDGDGEPLGEMDADGRIEPYFDGAPGGQAHMPVPHEPALGGPPFDADGPDSPTYTITRTAGDETAGGTKVVRARAAAAPSSYSLPPHRLLKKAPAPRHKKGIADDTLHANAQRLKGVLEDFGISGDIMNVSPGPVVTLYELEPAPGTKSSRVIGLADDIARSMSAIAARVAVIPGRNAIGIELPNDRREMVFLRELLESPSFQQTDAGLALALGKNIGGEPVNVDLSRMPHLLIAGTTGSGKSVGVNTMIVSLLYRLTPDQCKFIMIDPKMLELSVYDGIPHLLAPVVTDPKKAVVALKWTVKEMEDRYKKMSKLGVRNISGYNARVREAEESGEVITRRVQTGFDKETGQAIYEEEQMAYEPMPFIVVIVDEMADLMMVAGKDIEGAVQRLAQMARAAGIHLITATQRPSVDVVTGTIKANFPTRISFQVTSKVDSRTILGEQGAEQLLGQGDMLYMAGGGRIMRVHGPFVSDDEVEKIVRHLKKQGVPQYLESITIDDEAEDSPGEPAGEGGSSGDDLYDRAVAIVARDGKASTSYIQRRLSIGYNRAATLIERMEEQGVISPANHAGKREVLVGDHSGESPV